MARMAWGRAPAIHLVLQGGIVMHGRFRVLRRVLLAAIAFAAVAFPAAATFTPALAQATSTEKTALIDEESVTLVDGKENPEGTPVSLEQYAAEQDGYTVTVRSGPEWEAMTAPEFASYQVLIVGDPSCGGTALSAVETAHTWTPVVMGDGANPLVGNRVVVGTDPEYHYAAGHLGAEHLVQDGIAFAGGVAGATGVYFDTSCTDLPESPQEEEERLAGDDLRPAEVTQPILEGPDGRDKNDVLEHLTEAPSKEAWTEDTDPPCGGEVGQVAANPVFDTGTSKLLDSDIQGWGCSVHIAFPTFPSDFFPLAVDTETALKPTCGTDPEAGEEVCGEAYVLLAGEGIVAEAPNLTLTPKSETAPAGGTHTVVAYVHQGETPLAEKVVTFTVTGQNHGVGGTCTTGAGAPDPECKTDANGDVRFTYSDTNGVGNDTIDASVTLETTHEETTPVEDAKPAATLREHHDRARNRCPAVDAGVRTGARRTSSARGTAGEIRRAGVRRCASGQQHARMCREQRLSRVGQRQADRLGYVHARRSQAQDADQSQLARVLRATHPNQDRSRPSPHDSRRVHVGQQHENDDDAPHAGSLRRRASHHDAALHRLSKSDS